MFFRLLMVVCAANLSLLAPLAAQRLDMNKLAGMKARAIGPAGMSGRVTAIDVPRDEPDTLWVGTASGGLWRSTSGGISWEPLFDKQPCASIGALAVFDNNPSIVWVGTGEGNPRNSQTSGCGVFKSLDGGRTWRDLGLQETRNIHRILLHPDNPDIAWVGAQGSAWNEHEERGVYKTSDGGKTWKKVLGLDNKTGVGELVIDPTNPNKLLCALWEFRRWPWYFESGGAGSGLYLSHDGGENWRKLTHEDGLPKGDLGRMGLAIAPGKPEVVYALIEAEKNGLYRSDNGGHNWHMVSEKDIGNRPFYYAEIYVDPHNENRLYNLHSLVTVSEDGGKTFSVLLPFQNVHPDHHAFWIHPDDPNYLIEGNDGGLAISRDRGTSWRFVENLPVAQFYHIRTDNELPYNVYGGMQDNGSWRGPNKVWRRGGIRNSLWREVGFGDGFDVIPDPDDTRYGYGLSQGGHLYRYDHLTGHSVNIKPIAAEDPPLRFNWNAALAIDPFDSATLYCGSQFVHRSTDKGHSWQVISPDLTTNDPEKQKQLESGGLTFDTTQAENFTSLVAIAPSPLQKGMIWAGSDDGLLHLTRDGGQTWVNVTKGMKGVAKGSWIPQIHPSTYDAEEAFVVLEDHRRGNWTPYLYHTKNGGKSWRRLVDEDQVSGYALSFVQDPREPSLYFLGTEFGLYVSIDAGKIWNKWTVGFPTVSAMDLTVQQRGHDLVIGTFGRSAYVLDNLAPLRALAREGTALLEKPVHVFPIPEAYLVAWAQADGTRFAADAIFKGENAPYGAQISFVYNPQAEGETKKEQEEEAPTDKAKVSVEVFDSGGHLIRTFDHEAKPGLNRVEWALRRRGVRAFHQPPPKKKEAAEPTGSRVVPGTYTVRINNQTHMHEAEVEVRPDPRLELTQADYEAVAALGQRIDEGRKKLTAVMDRLRDAKEAIDLVNGRLGERDEVKTVKDQGGELKKEIDALMERVVPKEVQGILRDPNKVSALVGTAQGRLGRGPITENSRIAVDKALAAMTETEQAMEAFFGEGWQTYKAAVKEAQVSFFKD